MEQSIKIKKAVGLRTSREDFYLKVKRLGDAAAQHISNKTQMGNLRNIAFTTLKVTDILNYIKNQTAKNQTAKNQNKYGKSTNGWEKITDELLDLLYEKPEQLIVKSRDEIYSELKLSDPVCKQKIHLLLCREFIKQLTIHYDYKKSKGSRR